MVAIATTYQEARRDLDRRLERFAGMLLDSREADKYLVYDQENGESWVQSDTFYALDEMA